MTRKIQFANNAASTLAAGISNTATSLNVAPGDGSKFPSLTGSQYFMATLVKSDGTTEVIKVTARSTDTLTITRAAEPINGVSTAYAFSAGDRIELRMTAGSLANELDRLDAAALTKVSNKVDNYTVTEADISSLIRVSTASGSVTIALPQISSLTDDFDVIVAKVTSDNNSVTLARSGTDTINGQTSYQLSQQWNSAWAIADRSTGTWSIIASGVGSQINADALSGNGTAGPYTLSGDPGTKNNTSVYVGGVYQQKSTYTLSGTSLTLGGNVAAGVSIEVVWATPLLVPVGTPSDLSLTEQKFADESVSSRVLRAEAISGKVNAATSKTTPVDADEIPLVDSESTFSLKKLTWANIKATLKAYFDTIYAGSGLASKLQPVEAVVSANSLIVKLNPTKLDFRSATLTDGTPATRTVATQLTLTVPPVATLGTISSTQARLVILALDNAGTVELGICSLAGGLSLNETGLISTTAISAAATSSSVVYSTTARTSVPYRIVGFVDITEATAGIWSTAPTLVQGVGGKAFDRPAGITVSTTIVVTSGSAIDVTGIPSWAQRVTIHMDQIGTNGWSAKIIQIGSGTVLTSGYKSSGAYAGSGNNANGAFSSNGFYIQSVAAADRLCGSITLSRLPAFVYEQSHVLSTNINGVCTGGGTVVSNGPIDRVRITTLNGTDTFVAGWLTISWEA